MQNQVDACFARIKLICEERLLNFYLDKTVSKYRLESILYYNKSIIIVIRA